MSSGPQNIHPSRQCGVCNNRIIGTDWSWYCTTGTCEDCGRRAGLDNPPLSSCKGCGKLPIGQEGMYIGLYGYCPHCAAEINLEIERSKTASTGLVLSEAQSLMLPSLRKFVIKNSVHPRQERIEDMLAE